MTAACWGMGWPVVFSSDRIGCGRVPVSDPEREQMERGRQGRSESFERIQRDDGSMMVRWVAGMPMIFGDRSVLCEDQAPGTRT